jgi:hypothetical protein
MSVIALQRVVQDAELAPLTALPQASLELAHEPAGAKARQPTSQPQSHVSWRLPRQARTGAVLHARTRPRRPPGTIARPAATRAPPQIVEGELPPHDERLPHERRNVKIKKNNLRKNRAMFEARSSRRHPQSPRVTARKLRAETNNGQRRMSDEHLERSRDSRQELALTRVERLPRPDEADAR